MKNKKEKSYQDRLKAMKKSIEKNKNILDEDFPDDVTISGENNLLSKDEDELDCDNEENNEDEK